MDINLGPDSELRQVDARFNAAGDAWDDTPRIMGFQIVEIDTVPVNFLAYVVARPVDEIGAVSGLDDDLSGGVVNLPALGVGPGRNALLEEIDEHHRKALPQVFRKADGVARTRDVLTAALADEKAVVFLAEIQNQIIGFVYAYVRSIPDIPIRVPCRVGEIDMIAVARSYRRCGAGKALMETAHQWAGKMKLERLELSVWAFNQGARDFYEELEYEPAFIRMWKTGPFLPAKEA